MNFANDFEFLLKDRIYLIRDINNKYDLEHNAYLSFSGGKDSLVLHYMLDIALPNNNIPRVFVNTGIEYNLIVNFVNDFVNNDKRFFIVNSNVNIKNVLNRFGYPSVSKYHSEQVSLFHSGSNKNIDFYYLHCNKFCKHHFYKSCHLNISDKCCDILKKEPLNQWIISHNRSIHLTGIRRGEGGRRALTKSCAVYDDKHNLIKFHPLLVCDDTFISNFINKYSIKLCDLYLPPYSFDRTGCKGCPFNPDLQNTLNKLKSLLPNEYLQCEKLWKPVYDDYRAYGYRLNKRFYLFND